MSVEDGWRLSPRAATTSKPWTHPSRPSCRRSQDLQRRPCGHRRRSPRIAAAPRPMLPSARSPDTGGYNKSTVTEYKPQELDAKWQARWSESRAFEVEIDSARPKFYCLEMFAYPSGHAHVGH